MTDIKESLLNEIYSLDKKLYNDMKIKEYIFLLDYYKQGLLDKDYEYYFNDKCLGDYKYSLLGEISNNLEMVLYEKNLKNYDLMLFYKFIFLLKLKNQNKKLEKFLNSLKLDNSKKYFDEINKLNYEDNLSYEYLTKNKNDTINELFNIIKNKYNKKLDIIISDNDYLNVITKLITNDKYNDYNKYYNEIEKITSNEELKNLTDMYNFIIKTNFQYYMRYLIELDDEDLLTVETLNNIKNNNFNEKSKHGYITYIFLNIIEDCELPYNESFINEIKNIFKENNKLDIFNKIIKKNKEIIELLDITKNIFDESIKKIFNNKKLNNIILDILKYKLNNEITTEQYNLLVNDIKTIYNIKQNQNDKYEILYQYFNIITNDDINNLISFNLEKKDIDVNDLEKNINKFIKYELDIFNQIEVLGIKKPKSKKIRIRAPEILDNNSFMNLMFIYKKWIEYSNLINKKLNINTTQDINLIFKDLIFKSFTHYFKSLDYYLDLDDSQKDINNLFYYYNEKNNIKIIVNNMYVNILLYIKNNISKVNKNDKDLLYFTYKKLIDFFIDYKFYSHKEEKDITFLEMISKDTVLMTILNNTFIQLHNKLKENKLSIIKLDKFKEYMGTVKQFVIQKVIFENKDEPMIKKIISLNKNNNILTDNEIDYITYNFKHFKYFGKKLKVKDLELFKILINEARDYMKISKKQNIIKVLNNKQNQNQNEELQKHLKKLISGYIKIQPLKEDKTQAPVISSIANINAEYDISSAKKFVKNDNSYLDRLLLKKHMKSNEEIKNEFIRIVKNLVNGYFKILNQNFNINLDNYKSKVIDTITDNDIKIKNIQKKILYKIKNNNTKKMSFYSNSIINDIVKEVCLMFFIDKLISNGNIKNFMSSDKLSSDNNNNNSIINKKIIILKDNKIGKVIKKLKDNKYKIKVKNSKNLILNSNEFVLANNLKYKVVYITKGIYKGEYGIIQDLKIHKYLSRKEQKARENHIIYLNDLVKEKGNYINLLIKSNKTNNILGDEELNLIKKFRKKELDNILLIKDKDYIFKEDPNKKRDKIHFNMNLKKILFKEEKIILDRFRNEKIEYLRDSINNIKNELISYKNNDLNKKYIVKIFVGEKRQKNILLNKNQIKLTVNNDEIKNNNIIKKDNNIKFSNIYQLMKFLFFNLTNSIKNNDMEKIEYYHLIYNNSIQFINNIKQIDINKIQNKYNFDIVLEDKLKIQDEINNNIKSYEKVIKDNKNKKSEIKKYLIDYKKKLKKGKDGKKILTNEDKKILKTNLKDIKKIDKKLEELKDKKNKKSIENRKLNNEIKNLKEQQEKINNNMKNIKLDELVIKNKDIVRDFTGDFNIIKLNNNYYTLFNKNQKEVNNEININKINKITENLKKEKEDKEIIINIIQKNMEKINNLKKDLDIIDLPKCNLINTLILKEDFPVEEYINPNYDSEDFDVDDFDWGEED